jgi:predicted nucleic acid-binding protein
MVIVDTSVWIDFLADAANPQTKWIDEGRGREEIGLTELILCEVLQGFREDSKFDYILARLRLLPILDTSGIDLAVSSAQNYRLLRTKGVTVRKTIDCVIATFCIENGHSLLHRDRDFDGFEAHLGLSVIHP